MNDMNHNTNKTHDTTTPAELLDIERSLRAAGLAARAGATSERVDRVARATWTAAHDAAPAPLVFVAPRPAVFTPMRVAAMLAIGAALIASVLGLRSVPAGEPAVIARGDKVAPAFETPAASLRDELAMFDTYLASADASRSGIDAFVEDASDLQDRFDAFSSGEDWWSDTDASLTQGAS